MEIPVGDDLKADMELKAVIKKGFKGSRLLVRKDEFVIHYHTAFQCLTTTPKRDTISVHTSFGVCDCRVFANFGRGATLYFSSYLSALNF